MGNKREIGKRDGGGTEQIGDVRTGTNSLSVAAFFAAVALMGITNGMVHR
ncbi:MAG: hypothetical protein LBE84_10610 [Planctomycetota bacterium]|nr:hypothetical protein [Planctomycetota bacterium]